MDRMLKVGVAALLMVAGTAGAQEVVKPEPAKTADTAKGAVVTKNFDNKAYSPFWIWNDFMASLKVIRGEEVPEAIRTNAEQETVIVQANRDFREQLGAYIRSNKDELATLRAKLGETNTNGVAAEKQLVAIGKEGGVPPKQMADQIDAVENKTAALDPNSPEFKEALTRFRKLMTEAPDAKIFKERVEKVLTSDQRIEVEKRAKAMAISKPHIEDNAAAQKQVENMVNSYNINNPAIPEHVRERWTKMTTAQRFKAMRDIERRLKVNGGVWDKSVAPADPHSQATVPTATPAADPR